MDIKKLKDIVEKSDLSAPAKEVLYDLIPQADRPEIQAQILETIKYEEEMYGLAADEAEELLSHMNNAEKQIDAADMIEEEELAELTADSKLKMEELDTELKDVMSEADEFVKAVSSENTVQEVSAPIVPITQMPAQAPVQQAYVPAQQNVGFGGQQYNAPQPAPFPGNSGMGQQG